jgi:DNA end-binding protein Ku
MIEPFDKGLLATTLRYATEVRDQGAYFKDIPDLNLPAEMRQLAAHIVDTKAGHFEPKKFEDHYETALVELLRQKQAGQPVEPIGEEKPPARVINLMDALRASLKGEEEKKPAAASIDTRRAATKKKLSR